MKELSLHILDIVQNSIEANAKNIYLEIRKDLQKGILYIIIKDDGKGMPKEILEEIKNPFFTSRTTRKVGLGVPLFYELIKNCGGEVKINSEVGKGTEIYAEVPFLCVDLPPMGNLSGTILGLIVTNPDIDFEIKIVKNGDEVNISTKEIKKSIDIPINSPEVISFLKEFLNENLGGW
jgi:hypothetical protein|uniref:histidine kinase n=1 Tax=Dictyoglomus turgidum TaxID=513050 RepID=A0A7C3SQC2_9BACT